MGSTVDPETGRYTNTIGAAMLSAAWTDPEFDPGRPDLYSRPNEKRTEPGQGSVLTEHR